MGFGIFITINFLIPIKQSNILMNENEMDLFSIPAFQHDPNV